jgi:hypothetical protein
MFQAAVHEQQKDTPQGDQIFPGQIPRYYRIIGKPIGMQQNQFVSAPLHLVFLFFARNSMARANRMIQ